MREEIFRDIVNELNTREQVIAKQSLYFYILNNVPKYKHLPISSIVLAILEYLTIEGNLKNEGLSFIEIREFLSKLLPEGYDINFTEEELSNFTEYILKKITNEGSAFEYEYFNTNSKSTDIIHIKYVISKLDRYGKKGVLFYITPEGMELLLNTKEVADEYKISIQAVLLEKMLATNNLEDVLRTVKNINIEIRKQINSKQDIIETLQYGSTHQLLEYIQFKQNSIHMMKEDDKQLKQVGARINTYEEKFLEKIDKKDLSKEKEEHIKKHIHLINVEMKRCLSNHHNLLSETVNLIKRLPEIQKHRNARLFSFNLNFEEKINEHVKNNHTDYIKHIIEPLLKPNIKQIFSMAKLDAMFAYKDKAKKIEVEEAKKEEELGLAITYETETYERIEDNYTFYMRNLLTFVNENRKGQLEDFINHIRNLHGEMPLENSDFIPFIKDLVSVKELYFKEINNKQNKECIEKIFISTIQENKGLDFSSNKIIIKHIDTQLIKLSRTTSSSDISIELVNEPQ